MRHRPVRPLPDGPLLRLPRRPGLLARRSSAASSAGRASDGAALRPPRSPRSSAPPPARRRQVRLVRRLPADPPRPRGRAARAHRAVRDRRVPGGDHRTAPTGRTTSSSSRARSARRSRPRRSSSCAARRRCLVTIGACATAGGIQALRNWGDHDAFRAARLRPPRVRRQSLATATPDLRPRRGRRRAARLPDRSGPARRAADRAHSSAAGRSCPTRPSASSASGGASSASPSPAGDRLPRPGHPDRLRRALPGVRPRLLRLLRPARAGQRPRSRPPPPGGRAAGAPADVGRLFAGFTAYAEPFRSHRAPSSAASRRAGPRRRPARRRSRETHDA